MLGHVSCDRALCKAIDPCSAAKVPEEQRLEAKALLDARNGVASGNKKRAAQADETAEDDATHRASHQAKLRNKQESKCKVDSALSDMFDGLGIAHSKVDHPLVKRQAICRISENFTARLETTEQQDPRRQPPRQ